MHKNLCFPLNFRTSEDTLSLLLIDYKNEENPNLMNDTAEKQRNGNKMAPLYFPTLSLSVHQLCGFKKNKLDTFSVISDGKQ